MTATAIRGTHTGTPIRAVTISRITKMIPTICNVLLLIDKDNITQEIMCQPQWKAPLFPAMLCNCYHLRYADKRRLLRSQKRKTQNG